MSAIVSLVPRPLPAFHAMLHASIEKWEGLVRNDTSDISPGTNLEST